MLLGGGKLRLTFQCPALDHASKDLAKKATSAVVAVRLIDNEEEGPKRMLWARVRAGTDRA
jgi:hypothetical protein